MSVATAVVEKQLHEPFWAQSSLSVEGLTGEQVAEAAGEGVVVEVGGLEVVAANVAAKRFLESPLKNANLCFPSSAASQCAEDP